MDDITPKHGTRDTDATDRAIIRVDQLQALAGLLRLEEVVEQFASLSTTAQVALFGLFEDGLSDVHTTLVCGMEVQS